jgi:hypothetical protein
LIRCGHRSNNNLPINVVSILAPMQPSRAEGGFFRTIGLTFKDRAVCFEGGGRRFGKLAVATTDKGLLAPGTGSRDRPREE